MSLAKKSNPLVFVFKQMMHREQSGTVDLLISPQFYTVKKEHIPFIKYAFNAKKIAPSLFFGLEDPAKSYQYHVYKDNNKWIFISYCMDDILDFLAQKNIPRQNINNIYFTQQIAAFFAKPFQLDDLYAIVNMDGIAVFVNRKIISLDTHYNRSVSGISLPSKAIKVSTQREALFSGKGNFILSLVSIIMSVIFIAEGFVAYKKKKEYEQKTQEILSANKNLESSYIRKNIISKYATINQVEKNKRDFISTISQCVLQGNTMLISLNINDNKMLGKLKYTFPKDVVVLEQLVKQTTYKISKQSTNIIIVVGKP